MTSLWPRGAPVALGSLALALLACAPERDVVATELAAAAGAGAGASGGAGAAAGSGGSAGEQTTPSGPCQKLLDGAPALAFFDFENAQGQTAISDAAQARSLSVVGAPASLVLGPDGCGSAVGFGNAERWLRLDDDAAWNLSQGSIDAWFWVPPTVGEVMGIISRDQYGDHVGHFSVFLLKDRTVMARLQQSDIGAMPTLLTLGCSSEPLPAGAWAHFGFNFGPGGAALYVNGVLAARSGAPGLEVGAVTCGVSAPDPHIPELELPWVVGASIYASMDPPNVRQFPFLNGAIDNLRISAVERDFAAAF